MNHRLSWGILPLILLSSGMTELRAVDYVVTSTSIYQPGNLGLILQQASQTPGPHTITFDPAILPATIELSSSTRTVINYDLTMTGPGADQVTIDFGGYSPGFEISAGRTVVFSGLKFANARVVGPQGINGSFVGNPTPGGPAQGGAIFNSGDLTVTNCVFENCRAIGGDGGSGAQFTNQQGQPAGVARGGAIFSQGTSLTVTGCLFISNDATGGAGGRGASNTEGFEFSFGGGGGVGGAAQGGAIYVLEGTTSITHSTFASQTVVGGAGGAGGQFVNLNGSGTNPGGIGANAEGGAIYAASALSLIHCTIAHGIARPGSGGSSGFPLFAHSGVADGGGVFALGTVTIGNSLVGKNRVRFGSVLTDADIAGSFSSLGYNFIGALPSGIEGFTAATELTGTTANPLDPKLQDIPAPNGFAVGSLRLLPGSPAVDKGRALVGATVDQRGLPRTVDLTDVDFPNASGGDGTDIGAFESQTLPNTQPIVFSGGFFTVAAGQDLSAISVYAVDEDYDPLTLAIVGTPLPAGLTLNNDGTITGSTTVAGSAKYQFKANDGKEDSEVGEFTLLVNEAPSLVVNTTADNVSNIDGITSLREAVALAQLDGVPTPVTFDPIVFASRKTITGSNPISISSDVEISGPSAGININGLTFPISGGTVTFSKINFGGDFIGTSFIEVNGSANVTITECTLGGSTFLTGCPVTNQGGTVTLNNCTIAGNTVNNPASAILQTQGTLVVQNCTISGNVGPRAIYNSSGNFSIGNTIIAGNTLSDGGAASQVWGAVTSLGFNLIGLGNSMSLSGNLTGNQLNVSDPLFDPDGLRYNGGPTKTLALQPGSPAIDQGRLMGTSAFDQRGRARTFDTPAVKNATGGDGSDMGAFEVGAPEPFMSVRQVLGANVFSSELSLGASLEFNSGFPAEVGAESSLTFEIRNKGTAPLVLNGSPIVALQGTDAASFYVQPPAANSIPVGGSTTFVVTYWPQSPGSKSASLVIPSNDLTQPSFSLLLGGLAQDTYAVPPVLLSPKINGAVYPNAGVVFRLLEPPKAASVAIRFQLADHPFTTYTFDLPDVLTSGLHSVQIDTVAEGMPDATYYVSVDYEDVNGLSTSIMSPGVRIRPNNAITTLQRASNSTAPGVGTQGLPDDAVITGFNLPAIDDAGNITYLARWTSVGTKKKGTGLFLNGAVSGTTGGRTNLPGDSVFTSFTDPVIDGSQLVSIAGLAGRDPKPPVSAVVTALTTQVPPNLIVLAKVGDIAPDASGAEPAGGPVFRSFQTVDIRGGAIGLLAQLTGGEGSAKVTAANDLGLWIKNGSGPFRLALREGQLVGNKTISTMLVFPPAKVATGQGRGWLTKPSGTNGAVMTLVTFTDKTRAIVSAEVGGVVGVVSSVEATGTLGGPNIPGAFFASYGFPATNDRETYTFAASLRVGAGGVGKTDARGIFLSNPDGSFSRLARISQPSGILGSAFSLLGDPILSADDGVAFLATLKGGTITKTTAPTLWWKPGDGSLRLLAQGGAEAPDIPGAKWAAFTNLGITGGDRGPVFVATLLSGPGGVTKSNDTGVWACDFLGQPRLIFREGDVINGKTLTGFNLLRSTRGTLGITRSLNDTLRIAWLATFSDKSTALMTSEIP